MAYYIDNGVLRKAKKVLCLTNTQRKQIFKQTDKQKEKIKQTQERQLWKKN